MMFPRSFVSQGVNYVLVKLGANGSAFFTKGKEPLRQPIIKAAKVIDTTGAGDTFTAAFAVALVENKSKEECLRFAGKHVGAFSKFLFQLLYSCLFLQTCFVKLFS